MSTPRKDELARGWAAAERLVEEREDHVAAMSDEEFEREMRAQPAPEPVPSVDDIVARAKQIAARRDAVPARDAAAVDHGEVPRVAVSARDAVPARDAVADVIPIRRAWLWLVAAALGVAAIVVIALLAHPHPPDPWHPDDRFARARELRHEATAACEEKRFGECRSKLDDAQDLDPAGETLPEVQAARALIAESIAPDAGPPPPAPNDDRKPRHP